MGVAGVEGNGQRELARVLVGLDPPASGRVECPHTPGWIPQDRTHEAIVPGFSITENVALGDVAPAERGGLRLDWAAMRDGTETLLTRFDVRTTGPDQLGGRLSGGNQQKVVVGRELLRSQALLVAENPTRGLDVAAARFVHSELTRLREMGEEGPGIVLISTDLDEVLALSDRLFVLRKGRLEEVPDADRTREGVGSLMLGTGGGADPGEPAP